MKMAAYKMSIATIMAVVICSGMQYLAASTDCGVNKGGTSFRIIGGTFAKMCQYPWMGSLRATSIDGKIFNYCGTSIIDSTHVLTAAHCLVDEHDKQRRIIPASNLQVRTGTTHYQKGTANKVSEVFVHEKYDEYYHLHDIAILKLSKALKFTKCTGPICLPTDKAIKVGRSCRVMGWGITDVKSGASSEKLQWREDPMASIDACETKYGYVDGISLCGQSTSFCQGDSGGPYVCLDSSDNKYYQYGIVSLQLESSNCKGSGLYTHVPSYTSWIAKTVKRS